MKRPCIYKPQVCFIVTAFASVLLPPKIMFSLLLWKLGRKGPIWFHREKCKSLTFHFLGNLLTWFHCFGARKRLKVHNSGFSCYHGNLSQFWWILVHRHPKGYLSWKFQVSSPDGLGASLWVTDFVTERQAIYKLMWVGQFHWKHSLKRNRKKDCQYVYDEVLYCRMPPTQGSKLR